MKAYRKLNNNIIEIEVDVDINGNPLLPDNSTIEEKPPILKDHYLDIVNNHWVQVPIHEDNLELETLKNIAINKLSEYKTWYLDQPVEYNNRLFDADEQARIRLTQVLATYSVTNYVPPVWIDYKNEPYIINGISDLIGLVSSIQSAFATRFYEMNEIRKRIFEATTKEELDSIIIPTITT